MTVTKMLSAQEMFFALRGLAEAWGEAKDMDDGDSEYAFWHSQAMADIAAMGVA